MKLIIIIFLAALHPNDKDINSYQSFNSILGNYVDTNGKVNYNGIIDNPYDFNQYLKFIEEVSPNSHPQYFETFNAKMAFWINTYNALIIKLMTDHPDKDILNVSLGHLIWFKKFKVGNQKISLYKIENRILRKMNDPRIHFAINCGSSSCPPLGRRIFLGETLNAQLNEKTEKFINDKNNVYIDHENKLIYLNKIFKWYKKDYKNIRIFLIKYLYEKPEYSDIEKYNIKYYNYDWSSNKSKN